MRGKRRTIEVPESLYDRLSLRVKGSKFRSVSEYATHLLRERLAADDNDQGPGHAREEEEKVKARLRALGYL